MKINKFFTTGILGDSLALISGALLTLAFAPFGIYPLAILCPALLLALWQKVSTRRAFFRGFLFGLGLFGTGVYWVYISIHTFGNTSVPLALFITSALIAILALFPALNGYFLNRFFPNNNLARTLCAFPAIWVMLEWLRSSICSGFPWLFIGYSQIHSPLKGYAPIFSVYGVSLAVILSAALLLNAAIQAKHQKYKTLYFNLMGIVFIWVIGGVLSFIPWTKPEGSPIKVSMVQGNIAQELKWSPEQVEPTLKRYQELTEQHWDSKLIIWPESAIPLPLNYAEDFVNKLDAQAKKHHTSIITGVPVQAPDPNSYYNSVITLGEGKGVYVKQRLVPFGEYIPAPKVLRKFLDFMQIPMSDFIPGKGRPAPIQIDKIKIATFICYEIAFPEQVLRRDGDVNMILAVSNDAWFDGSIAQAQHLEMAQMRAAEMGRPVIFVSNTGITAAITPNGKIQTAAPIAQSYVLTETIQPMKGKTPWQYASMDPILLILVILLLIGIRCRKQM